MAKNEPKIAEYANLRQALEWAAFALPPLERNDEIIERGDYIEKYNHYEQISHDEGDHEEHEIEQVNKAKRKVFEALHKEYFMAEGNIDGELQSIPSELWNWEGIDWDNSCLTIEENNKYFEDKFEEIRIKTNELFLCVNKQTDRSKKLIKDYNIDITLDHMDDAHSLAKGIRSQQARDAVNVQHQPRNTVKDFAKKYFQNKQDLLRKECSDRNGKIVKAQAAEYVFWKALSHKQRKTFPAYDKILKKYESNLGKEQFKSQLALYNNGQNNTFEDGIKELIKTSYKGSRFSPYKKLEEYF